MATFQISARQAQSQATRAIEVNSLSLPSRRHPQFTTLAVESDGMASVRWDIYDRKVLYFLEGLVRRADCLGGDNIVTLSEEEMDWLYRL